MLLLWMRNVVCRQAAQEFRHEMRRAMEADAEKRKQIETAEIKCKE
jgi:hypothetical protein